MVKGPPQPFSRIVQVECGQLGTSAFQDLSRDRERQEGILEGKIARGKEESGVTV